MKDELKGKRIVILGLARQGVALARFAVHAGANVVVSDLRTADQLETTLREIEDLSLEIVLGDHPLELLEGADLLALSGGVPLELPIVREAINREIELTNDSHEFMKRAPAKVIGITGSAGKTTTTALTGLMSKLAGKQTWIGGNIGQPLISDLDKMQPEDIVVQELSSFQLDLWRQSPPIAAVLNVTPNHLDRHHTMDAYLAAKGNIIRFQQESDVAILSADDAGAQSLGSLIKGRLRQFSLHIEVEDGAFIRQGQIWLTNRKDAFAVCSMDIIRLKGWHNVSNVLASTVLADSIGIPPEAIRDAIADYTGESHRLESVDTIDGVQYINDSIATAPERAVAAINSFNEPLVLLAGGKDKDLVWDNWAKRVRARVKAVVLFGNLADHLKVVLESDEFADDPIPIIVEKTTLKEAVNAAAKLAKPGDVVLFAPGGTSFDSFRDFEERGMAFRELVHNLSVKEGVKPDKASMRKQNSNGTG